MKTKADLERVIALRENEVLEFKKMADDAIAKLMKVERDLIDANKQRNAIQRELEGELSIIRKIRFACETRIKVTHDCDVSIEWSVDGNGQSKPVPVCEDVRFLREIVSLCRSNDAPF